MENSLLAASLVWDGGPDVFVPASMGTPREDQLQGTPGEKLSEVAGRICYDSLGTGRPSFTQEVVTGADPHTGEQLLKEVEGYHDHIKKVNHTSVLGHYHFTVEIFEIGSRAPALEYALAMLNRPGCHTVFGNDKMRITLNLRAALEAENFGQGMLVGNFGPVTRLLKCAGHMRAPAIVENVNPAGLDAWRFGEPQDDDERWVSLFLSGSRGFSHEQVRHGYRTGISQRSTRYVDESESPWVEHPLVTEYLRQNPSEVAYADGHGSAGNPAFEVWGKLVPTAIKAAKQAYAAAVPPLEKWLISKGVDKTSARKQARGAARGYLGNALYTDMIFSASIAEWKLILRQRASAPADAEIREVSVKVFQELQKSRYANCFAGWQVLPAPDGIGQIVQESA